MDKPPPPPKKKISLYTQELIPHPWLGLEKLWRLGAGEQGTHPPADATG